MKLNNLSKTKTSKKKRVGRGFGSGKGGHTAGRGQKGQKSRSKVGLLFQGTKMRKSLVKRLPMMRGKLKFKSYQQKPFILNVKYLNFLKTGTKVTIEVLIKKGLVDKKAGQVGVKILGDGKLEKNLIVALPVSKGAKIKIEKAGGKVLEPEKLKKPEAGDKVKKSKTKKQVKKSKSKTKQNKTTEKNTKVKKSSVKKSKAK
jgi:large subunit ribosomal protein L15